MSRTTKKTLLSRLSDRTSPCSTTTTTSETRLLDEVDSLLNRIYLGDTPRIETTSNLLGRRRSASLNWSGRPRPSEVEPPMNLSMDPSHHLTSVVSTQTSSRGSSRSRSTRRPYPPSSDRPSLLSRISREIPNLPNLPSSTPHICHSSQMASGPTSSQDVSSTSIMFFPEYMPSDLMKGEKKS